MRSSRDRRWLVGATLGLAGLALAGHGAAPLPRAQACGACLCAETDAVYLVFPDAVREVPLDARVFVAGPGVVADAVSLRARESGEVVDTDVVLEGATDEDGLWLVPRASLDPHTTYEVIVSDASGPIGWLETGTASDPEPPVIASVTVDPEGGTLRSVCGEKLGIALSIETVGLEHSRSLARIDVIGPDGARQLVMQVGEGLDFGVGRWDAGREAWGGNCLGRADVPWLDPGASVSVEVTLFDRAGNPSDPVRLDAVDLVAVPAPSCPSDATPERSPSSGCSAVGPS